ncbi:MAG: nucleotide exchange factor GrpE [Phycisphaerales bacterium]|nr:nucleotide exchange factor GrpE [Phycisphaerales bacterium]
MGVPDVAAAGAAVAPTDDTRPARGAGAAGGTGIGADSSSLEGAIAGASEAEQLRARVADLEDQLLRARAEQQNIRKRTANELSEAVRYGHVPFVKSLLVTMDDFDRALAQGEGADPRTVVAGVRLVYDNLMKALREHGIEPIEALGRPFDPHQHEAVQQAGTADAAPGTVIAVLQGGFRMGDRVLRPAKVMIAAPRESDRAPAGEGVAGAPAKGAE